MRYSSRPASRRRGVVAAGLGAALLLGCAAEPLPRRADAGGGDGAPPSATALPSPLDVAAREALARTAAGDPAAALDRLDAEGGPARGHALALAARGQALLALGRHEEAADAFRRSLSREPLRADVLHGHALALMEGARLVLGAPMLRRDRLDLARHDLLRAVELEPRRVAAWHALGRVEDLSGRPDLALRHFEHALTLGATDPEVHFHLGIVLLKEGRTQDAVEHLRAARAGAPEDAEAAYHLGKALLRSGRVEEAVTHLTAATRRDPLSRPAAFNLAMALERAGRSGEAAAARARFERLGTEEPDREAVELAEASRDPRLLAALGLQHEQAGRLEDAVAAYARAVEGEESFDVLLRLGALRCRLGQPVAGERALRRAGEIRTDLAVAPLYLAGALEQQGRLDEALEAVREAARREPDSYHAHRNEGLLLQRLGRDAEARAALARAERLRPEGGPP